MKVTDIIRKYSIAEATLEETNAALEIAGANVRLNPEKNTLTEDELAVTFAGDTPETVGGWGLLDSGTGTLDKVHVVEGQLVNCNMGESFAMVFIGGKAYEVKGDTLI
jgi:hypothetical protein